MIEVAGRAGGSSGTKEELRRQRCAGSGAGWTETANEGKVERPGRASQALALDLLAKSWRASTLKGAGGAQGHARRAYTSLFQAMRAIPAAIHQYLYISSVPVPLLRTNTQCTDQANASLSGRRFVSPHQRRQAEVTHVDSARRGSAAFLSSSILAWIHRRMHNSYDATFKLPPRRRLPRLMHVPVPAPRIQSKKYSLAPIDAWEILTPI